MYSLSANAVKEAQTFKTNVLTIAQPLNGAVAQATTGQTMSTDFAAGYQFSTWNMVNLVDSALNSHYLDTPQIDSDGNKKLYFNIVYPAYEIAMKNIKLTPANFIFNPDLGEEAIAELARHAFREYLRTNTHYGEDLSNVMDALNSDYVKYGSAVAMRRENLIEHVPIKSIRISPNAKSIKEAILNGGYFIIEKRVTFEEAKQWLTPDKMKEVPYYEKTKRLYARWGRVPRKFYDEFCNGKSETDIEISEDDKKDSVIAMSITLDVGVRDNNNAPRQLLFLEEIREDEIPFDEVHYHKVDGRWLGVGAVERIIQNQVAINFAKNEQRKALLWSSKKIFTTNSKRVQKNILREAKTGQIFYIPDGNLTPIDVNFNTSDLQGWQNDWQQNAQEGSFSFEAVSGDTMPSGTPFRLGVLLSNNAMMFYKMKQEKLGLFYRQLFYNNIIPVFKRTYGGTLRLKASSGLSKQLLSTLLKVEEDYIGINRVMAGDIEGDRLSPASLRSQAFSNLKDKEAVIVKLGDLPFKKMRSGLDVELTNTEIDVTNTKESLITFWQTLVQQQSPMAQVVLNKIMQLNNIDISTFEEAFNASGLGQQQGQQPYMQAPANAQDGLNPEKAENPQLAMSNVPSMTANPITV